MNEWDALCIEAGRVRLDLDVAEAEMIELETRATDADSRAEAAWERLMALTAGGQEGSSETKRVATTRPALPVLPDYEWEHAMGRA